MKNDRYILVVKSNENGVSMFFLCSFQFFFFPPFSFSFVFPILIWSPLSIFLCFFVLISSPLSIFPIQNPPYYPFLFAHTLLHSLEQRNDSHDKMVQMRAHQTCLVLEVSIHCTHNVRLTILFSFVLFFLTTNAGFANIFEIKCNCF